MATYPLFVTGSAPSATFHVVFPRLSPGIPMVSAFFVQVFSPPGPNIAEFLAAVDPHWQLRAAQLQPGRVRVP